MHRGLLHVGERRRRIGFEVHAEPGACPQSGFIWTHGLTSSRADEERGGWPFGGVADVAQVMPVTLYDARGHGVSDPACEEGYTWQALGRDVVRLHKAWGKRRAFLGGTSMGAAASLFAALEAPGSFRGLVLATPPTCHEQRRKFVPLYLESIEVARKGGLAEAYRIAASKTRPPIFMESEQGRSLFEVGWTTKMDMGLDRYCAALEGATLSDLPSQNELRHIELPTLILAWRSDVQHPVETAEMLHATLPRAELVVAKCWSDIEKFPQHIRDFLRKYL